MRKSGIVLIFILIIFGCSKDECSTNREVALCLEDVGCSNTSIKPLNDLSTEFQLIRSQEEFEMALNNTCETSISWGEYDLVIGQSRLTNGVSQISKHTIMNCETNQLNLFIEIETNLTAVAPEVYWNALIPKLADNETLFVQIDINN